MPAKIRRMSPIQRKISHRVHDPREMLLRSAGKLFQDVGYVQASIYRIASAVNAPKGTFYNYFRSKEDLASRLVDRQFEALRESLSRLTGHSAGHQLKEHCSFLAIEPPMVSGPASTSGDPRCGGTSDPRRPYATYRSWHRHLDHSCKRLDITRSDRKRNTNCARSPKAGVTAGHLLVRGDRS